MIIHATRLAAALLAIALAGCELAVDVGASPDVRRGSGSDGSSPTGPDAGVDGAIAPGADADPFLDADPTADADPIADAAAGTDAVTGADAAGADAAGSDAVATADAAGTDAASSDAAGGDAANGDAGPPGPIFQGSFVVTNTIDQATISAYSGITGNLDLRAPGMTAIALPNLQQLGGTLRVADNPDLVTLLLPQLEVIGGSLEVTNDPLLGELALPALTRIGEHLDVGLPFGLTARTNRVLARIDLPALTEVGGFVRVRQNGLFFDPFTTLGLRRVLLPALVRIGYGLEIADNNQLEDFDLAALADVDRRTCPGISGCISILHDVVISGNTLLPECRVDALYYRLRARGYAGGFSSGYHDDDGICN